jgi:hypothetical protein
MDTKNYNRLCRANSNSNSNSYADADTNADTNADTDSERVQFFAERARL